MLVDTNSILLLEEYIVLNDLYMLNPFLYDQF